MEQLKEYLDTTNLSEDQKKAILGIIEAYGSEMLHEYPPVYNAPGLPVTSKELEYLEGISKGMQDGVTKGIKEQLRKWDDSFDIGL